MKMAKIGSATLEMMYVGAGMVAETLVTVSAMQRGRSRAPYEPQQVVCNLLRHDQALRPKRMMTKKVANPFQYLPPKDGPHIFRVQTPKHLERGHQQRVTARD
jgi:hypothetical protein